MGEDASLQTLPQSFLLKYSEMLGRLSVLSAVIGADASSLAQHQAKLEPLLPPSWQSLSNKLMAEVRGSGFHSPHVLRIILIVLQSC